MKRTGRDIRCDRCGYLVVDGSATHAGPVPRCPECGRSMQMQRAMKLWNHAEDPDWRTTRVSPLWLIPVVLVGGAVVWIAETVLLQ